MDNICVTFGVGGNDIVNLWRCKNWALCDDIHLLHDVEGEGVQTWQGGDAEEGRM